VIVFVASEGGMMLELAIGGQKFWFRPAVLGRTKKAPATKRPTRTRSAAKRATRDAAKSAKVRKRRKASYPK